MPNNLIKVAECFQLIISLTFCGQKCIINLHIAHCTTALQKYQKLSESFAPCSLPVLVIVTCQHCTRPGMVHSCGWHQSYPTTHMVRTNLLHGIQRGDGVRGNCLCLHHRNHHLHLLGIPLYHSYLCFVFTGAYTQPKVSR